MKSILQKALLLTSLITLPAIAEQAASGNWPTLPPDKEKVSYAFGMQVGTQAKGAGGDMNVKTFAQAMKDVIDGKPTKLQQSEIAAILNQGRTEGLAKEAAKDVEKISYALGMQAGLQLKASGAEVDPDVIAQAIKDVLDGKPTKVQESEIPGLFKQAQAYGLFRLSEKNKAEAAAFLANNAKAAGVTALPDGLQYRILKAGTGALPTTNDLLIVKYRGTYLDGTEFGRKDQFITRVDGGLKGWQEALRMMKVGSKWQLFIPSDLAFGEEGEAYQHITPNQMVIYELELLSIPAPGEPLVGTGRMGHGTGNGVFSSSLNGSAPSPVVQDGQKDAAANKVSPEKNP